METLTIQLTAEQLDQLRERAKREQCSPEEMARIGLEEWLSEQEVAYQRAAERVLQKNAELYDRLS